MPELPEVETIRLGLEEYLSGKKLEKVELKLPKIVLAGSLNDLIGSQVMSIRRFGKVLVLDFDNNHSMVVHIKLTGQLVLGEVPQVSRVSRAKVGTLPNRWTHLILRFSNGTKLYYNDLRQFGWIRVLPTESVEHFLLDQRKIGGVGNIYANDALFLAKIDPQRPAKTLSSEEIIKLYEALLEVLKRGLKYGGASELSYVNALGEEGDYQKHFLVLRTKRQA